MLRLISRRCTITKAKQTEVFVDGYFAGAIGTGSTAAEREYAQSGLILSLHNCSAGEPPDNHAAITRPSHGRR
jgi:hypothetical protein